MAAVTLWFERQRRGVPAGGQRQLVVGEQIRKELRLGPPAGFVDDELGGEKLRWSVKTEFDFSEFEA